MLMNVPRVPMIVLLLRVHVPIPLEAFNVTVIQDGMALLGMTVKVGHCISHFWYVVVAC